MTTWAENLDKVVNGTATKVEFVDAITFWLGTEIAESTEGMYEAVSRRVVWVFPDSYALAVGTNFDPVFYHLSEELSEGSPNPLPETLQKDWLFSSKSNGWSNIENGGDFPAAESILNLVELFAKTHGEPKVMLPWGYLWTDSIVDQADEDDWSTDEGEVDIQETMFHLATAETDGTLAKVSPWELESTDEDDGLSYYSDFSKFQRFIKKVSEGKIAILDLDQHCAGCCSGTYENAVQDDPELEGKEIFRTWGQNSENMWLGDGSICVEASIENPELEKQLLKVAKEVGLDMGIDDENWQASGSFAYES